MHDVAELHLRARTLVSPCISLTHTLSQSTYAWFDLGSSPLHTNTDNISVCHTGHHNGDGTNSNFRQYCDYNRSAGKTCSSIVAGHPAPPQAWSTVFQWLLSCVLSSPSAWKCQILRALLTYSSTSTLLVRWVVVCLCYDGSVSRAWCRQISLCLIVSAQDHLQRCKGNLWCAVRTALASLLMHCESMQAANAARHGILKLHEVVKHVCGVVNAHETIKSWGTVVCVYDGICVPCACVVLVYKWLWQCVCMRGVLLIVFIYILLLLLVLLRFFLWTVDMTM